MKSKPLIISASRLQLQSESPDFERRGVCWKIKTTSYGSLAELWSLKPPEVHDSLNPHHNRTRAHVHTNHLFPVESDAHAPARLYNREENMITQDQHDELFFYLHFQFYT